MKGNRNMKRVLAILLTIALLTVLVGCDKKEQPKDTQAQTTAAPAVETTNAPEEETTVVPEETTAPEQVVDEDVFSFTYQGVTLVPGNAFDSAALPEAESVYQVPSCAIEGTDNVYNFNDAVEITAFNDGSQEIIYSIAIFDPNVCTDEGLYLGDDMARVIELYGEDYTENGTAMVYTKGNTELTIILQNGFVVDMEFKWITE